MKYFIGIDGGGTKTDCIITDENYNQLYALRGGPLNLLTSLPAESSKVIRELIKSCLSKLNLTMANIDCIGIGAAGAGRFEDAQKLEQNLKNLLLQPLKLNVTTDAEAALEGAFNGKPGSILISGTGSIILGKDQKGIIHRCGGFGKLLGDEGSGYMVGKKGLIAAAKEFDGRGERSLITHLLKDKFHIESRQNIITAVYNNNLDISAIAPLVLASAENNDKVALGIIDEETEELLNLINCMIKKLNTDNFEISFIGRLICSRNVFSSKLKEKLIGPFRSIKVKEPECSPAMGAIFIAKKKFTEIL